ncbi:hypothetical protein JCM3774_004700 [Rhodotorula dairenensis]
MGAEPALLHLSPDEISTASHEVLASLVLRYQDELALLLEDSRAKGDFAARTEEDRFRVEHELKAAKQRIDDLLNEQARTEGELSGRIEVLDKLRANVRELEREKKEATRRYREQAETHEAERQAWHDQEQHLKLRIADLTTSPKKRQRHRTHQADEADDSEPGHGALPDHALLAPETALVPINASNRGSSSSASSSTGTDRAAPTAEELSLASQLASLSTAHESLTSSYRALQNEMCDLKRVYQDLQDENESYEILLGERTLSGEVRDSHIFRSSAAWNSSAGGASRGMASGLSPLDEHDHEDEAEDEDGQPSLSAEDHSAVPDVDKANGSEDELRPGEEGRHCGGRAHDDDQEEHLLSGSEPARGIVEELRQEVRALKDANKALTLYVSKIVDRVCQQEGFEKVLAVDYRPAAVAPVHEPLPVPSTSSSSSSGPASLATAGNGETDRALAPPATPTAASPSFATEAPQKTPASALASPRRAGSLLESVSSVFNFGRSQSSSPSPVQGQAGGGMKPLVLAGSVCKLDRDLDLENEDEEDRRERARIHAEMVQLGFDPPPASRLAAASSRQSSTSSSTGCTSEDSFSPRTQCPSDDKTVKGLEQHALNELKAGRSSGFTEPPPRRASTRQSLKSSPRLSEDPAGDDAIIGLGIARSDAPRSPGDYFGTVGKSPSSSPAVSPSEGAPVLRKALRRLSSAFTSPPVGS